MFPPSLVELLRSRKEIPYLRNFGGEERMVILPSEDASTSMSRGRPFGPDYYDTSRKLEFMETHGIDISVLSLANPWLDWVASDAAAETARMVNDDFEAVCASHPGKLYTFGTLPLSGTVKEVVAEISRLKTLKYCRGVVMGTSGFGHGLDDLGLEEVWAALEKEEMMLFLHPHYGLPGEVFGPRAGEYGHVLALAMGFPMETTIAVTRM
jgi:predicted TIM-barrel fold metal-dependent hydrolase